MKTAEAVALLSKLEQLRQDVVAITPDQYSGSGLESIRKLVNAETREVIFVYVKRTELIEVIRKAHGLCRTSNLRDNLGAIRSLLIQ